MAGFPPLGDHLAPECQRQIASSVPLVLATGSMSAGDASVLNVYQLEPCTL